MIKTIIFDLGNVLLNFDQEVMSRRIAAHYGGDVSLAGKLSGMNVEVEKLETGRIGEAEFMAEMLGRLGVAEGVDAATMRDWWNDIFWVNRHLLEILPSLPERVRLVMLSNTNPMHAAFVRERFPEVFEGFDDVIFSHETGRRKPDPDLFREALERAGAAPDECLYFDDIDEHVAAARALGIHAYPYVSAAGARDILRVYELL